MKLCFIKKKIFVYYLLSTQILISQGLTLSDAQPFCSDNELDFISTYGNPPILVAETLPNFGCLNSGLRKNPIWYFLKIGNPGNLTLELTSKDVNNNPVDADFVAWGPFNRTEFQNVINDGTGKDLQNVIDCSSSPDSYEVIEIEKAEAEEYYIVMITNYFGDESSMRLEEKFPDDPNRGTTDCSVLDTTAPEITLVGSDTVTIEAGTTYTDAGATALDNYDGDITSAITIGGDIVDTSIVGSYTITYNVNDSNGNSAAEVIRTVLVVDTTAPEITLVGSATVTIEASTIYTDAGATALDNYDGDITSAITIGGDIVDTSILGSYTINYNVNDSNGNSAAEVTRTVLVIDSTLPIITLLGDVSINIETGGIYTDAGATALDNYDGDITSAITIGGDVVDTSIVGSYTITYNVNDSNGNSADEVTRTVLVVKSLIVEIPSFFTPNGDGINDNWEIKIINLNFMIKKLVIFDRYGKTIESEKDKWDGTYNGKKMPEGSYWYKLILEGRNGLVVVEKGHFSLAKGY